MLQNPVAAYLSACMHPASLVKPGSESRVWKPQRQSTEQQLDERYTRQRDFASSHWLWLWYPPDCVSAAESDDRRKHVSTGEEAIHAAVGDQLF